MAQGIVNTFRQSQLTNSSAADVECILEPLRFCLPSPMSFSNTSSSHIFSTPWLNTPFGNQPVRLLTILQFNPTRRAEPFDSHFWRIVQSNAAHVIPEHAESSNTTVTTDHISVRDILTETIIPVWITTGISHC